MLSNISYAKQKLKRFFVRAQSGRNDMVEDRQPTQDGHSAREYPGACRSFVSLGVTIATLQVEELPKNVSGRGIATYPKLQYLEPRGSQQTVIPAIYSKTYLKLL